MRRRWASWLWMVSGLAWSLLPAQVSAQSPELKRLHALLIIDTRAGLGESVLVDGRRMTSILKSGIPPRQLDLTVFDKAQQLTRQGILGYFRNLHTGPSDAVLFYYAGHGATDPEKGQFLALQELKTEPLTRDELRHAMLETKPGLVVILTDCCSNRYELKKRNRDVWESTHRESNPVLQDLLLRHRGIVDITATSGNEAFGDEHQGGVFTRTLGRLLNTRAADLDTNHDGFVDWKEFFPRLQKETEGAFTSWARQHRALGEAIDQKSQRPRAFRLPGEPAEVAAGGAAIIRNDTDRSISYEFRWKANDSWKQASVGPGKSISHPLPAGMDALTARLQVRSREGNGTAKPGSTLRFHD